MTYLVLLAIMIAGAVTYFQHFLPSQTVQTTAESGISTTLDAARTAANQLSGNTNNETEAVAEGNSQTTEPGIMPGATATAVLGGGCFWCVEADLEKLPGVKTVVSGYAGGSTERPTYENYSKGGHTEVVEVTYDPAVVSFEEIMIYAVKHMDPTDGAGSFNDRGVYYAPVLHYQNETEKNIITKLIAEIDAEGPYDKPLAVVVAPTPQFWPAEDYHQDYYKGTVSGLRYQYYRAASGRDAFIKKYWGTDTGVSLPWRINAATATNVTTQTMQEKFWLTYVKPSAEMLKTQLDPIAFKVTQEEGTERAGTSPLDKNYERGIYVDILSKEPLFSSKDKFDSGTGWPSFVKTISTDAVTEHEDNTFFSRRVEVRSTIADNHLGHVFPDGPRDRGGMRYCMNGVALEFIPEAQMEAKGYGSYIASL